MKQKPSIQFYTQDFLASMDVQLMSAEEVGCYCLLIFNAYVNDGSLPDDAEALRRLCRGIKPTENVLKKFYKTENKIRHKKIDEILENQKKFSKAMSKAAEKRWSKERNKKVQRHMPTHSKGKAKAKPKQCSLSSSSSLNNNIISKEITLLSDFLFACIKQNNENFKGDPRKWDDQIDKMVRIDKRDTEEIKQIIMFCQQDDFWHKNILSGAKLRQKYDQLFLAAKGKLKQVSKNQVQSFGI